MGNNFKNKIKTKLFLVFLIIIVVFLGTRVVGEWKKRSEINDEIARLKSEAERLASRNLEILELSQELTTEEFLEREARLKLGLQKPGESVLVLGREAGAPELATRAAVDETTKLRNAKRWWYYFFDHDQFNALKSERDSNRPIKR